ncbi:MAG: helix-turn-helix transcriptional regulator [Coprothermobacterota bacterium]|nr:helix-turn-helix transcriptional regulator [Coprothermobacterota bacterium]
MVNNTAETTEREGRKPYSLLGLAIRNWELTTGGSVPQLAEYLQVQRSTIYDWMHGKSQPRIDFILKICEFYGLVKVDDSELRKIRSIYQFYSHQTPGESDEELRINQLGGPSSPVQAESDLQLERSVVKILIRALETYQATSKQD